jgi:hypothetical protein
MLGWIIAAHNQHVGSSLKEGKEAGKAERAKVRPRLFTSSCRRPRYRHNRLFV